MYKVFLTFQGSKICGAKLLSLRGKARLLVGRAVVHENVRLTTASPTFRQICVRAYSNVQKSKPTSLLGMTTDDFVTYLKENNIKRCFAGMKCWQVAKWSKLLTR